jgi:hypothetical protein
LLPGSSGVGVSGIVVVVDIDVEHVEVVLARVLCNWVMFPLAMHVTSFREAPAWAGGQFTRHQSCSRTDG